MKNYCILGILLLLVACAPTDPVVEQFLDIYPDATKKTDKYATSDAAFVKEFFTQECTAEPPFERTVYEQYGARLIIYVKDREIVCAVSKIEPATLSVQQGNPENAPEGVALLVNDQPVMFSQVQAVFATLPQEQQTLAAINTIIDQLVTQELLAQEANHYIVNAEAAYAELLSQSDLDEATLLANANTTKEAVLAQLTAQLQVQELINDKIGTYELDEEQAQQFYLDNTQAFIISEQAVFQQIYISTQTRSREAAATRADVAIRSLNTTDFCTVVKQYSDDEASQDVCGIYTIPRGAVNPQIEQTVFNTPPGQLVGVETETGFHLITVLEVRPPSVQRYEDVQGQVAEYVQGQVQQSRLNAYVSSLRTNAEVISYLTVQ